ncbi:MAG: IS110 family transposase [Bacteriovoracales bacterium]|nr:IS110 family transposase [Bacteriovoracales bacterium]
MKRISTMGIDLAKNTFQLHAADRKGGKVFNKKVKREKLLGEIEKFDKEDDFLIAMEACGGAHHVARALMAKGYDVKLIAPKFVKPFVKSNKNDAKDAEAITEATRRPSMRFVGVKSVEQQNIQAIHRIRAGFVKRKTAMANEMRGLLLEYGITIPQGIHKLKKLIPAILSDVENGLTLDFRELLQELYSEWINCFEKVEHYDKKLSCIYNRNEDCKRLSKIDGVGLITATALVAAVGDPKAFKNGREFSAWLGLTPRQHSTGGKTTLLGISKRGDSYLRKNLIHGCRAVIYRTEGKEDRRSRWIKGKLPSKGVNKVSVALANKTARAIWAVLARKEEYRRVA